MNGKAQTLHNNHKLDITSISIYSKMDKLGQANNEILYNNYNNLSIAQAMNFRNIMFNNRHPAHKHAYMF